MGTAQVTNQITDEFVVKAVDSQIVHKQLKPHQSQRWALVG
jgi:hypothetical protein